MLIISLHFLGNGPAALFLSFLLHGNIPSYDPITYGPHPDPVLHRKLCADGAPSSLYEILQSPEDIAYLTEHFDASNMSYSTQAQPVNVLLDTLLRPNGDLDAELPEPRLKWETKPNNRINHLVLGSAPSAGGQWSESPVATSSEIRTLSYADMLSLPGYTFFDHYRAVYGKDIPPFTRPTRKDVSEYYSAYPKAAGISSAIASETHVYHVERSEDSSGGFFVQVLDKSVSEPISYTIRCKHIVLASGIFTHVLAPPKHLQMLQEPAPISFNTPDKIAPLLLIGTGFTAADVILSADPSRKIIHIFKWDVSRSSPLKGCHPQAYPEYANIYRQMKIAAMKSPMQYSPSLTAESQLPYEGFANGEVISARPHPSLENMFTITISLAPGVLVTREVSNLSYFVGRRGDLTYLSRGILSEIGLSPEAAACISGDTLRQNVAENVEIEKGIFVIGSLTGDSLVKFGFGSGVYAAGSIHRASKVSLFTRW
ncbi:hypothetical protein DFH27DRAFT_590717 [Peziza echinospora]|nr:hypothetical protein DFH27DRAFT_590717 [Peziza echinospora]